MITGDEAWLGMYIYLRSWRSINDKKKQNSLVRLLLEFSESSLPLRFHPWRLHCTLLYEEGKG